MRQKEEALREAESQRKRAEQNFVKARVALQDVLLWPALGREGQLPVSLQKKFLVEVATKYYTSLGDETSTDPSLRYDAAVGQRTLGFLYKGIGNLKRSEELLRRSISTLDALHREHADRPEYRQQLGWSDFMLSETLFAENRGTEAQAAAQRAREIYESLFAEHPEVTDYREELLVVYGHLAALHKLCRPHGRGRRNVQLQSENQAGCESELV